MNILIYTITYPAPPEMRTARDTLVVHYFAKALREAGHNVQVIHMSCLALPSLFKDRFRGILPREADYVHEGIPVHLFQFMALIPHQSNPQRYQAAIINRRLKKFKAGLGWKPDKVFVHFPTLFTGITEIFADGSPVMGDFHNIDIFILNKRYLTPGLNGRIAAFLRRFDHWGYRNINVRAGLEAIESRQMVRTYSGIDRSCVAPEAFIQEKISARSDVMRIVYAGQLIPLKNVDILIQAVRKLSFPWTFTIVGGGSEEKRLHDLAAGDGRIRFTGRLSRENTIGRMKDADVFIMLSKPETYGLVYLEAMAQGCVTVASRGQGFDGIITDGVDGYLEEPESVEAAARILEKIHVMTQVDRAAMILSGYRLAASMTEDQTAQRFLDDNTPR